MYNASLLKKEAVQGVLLLSIRRVILQIILTGSNIVLARLLFPEVFGVYAIVCFVVGFFEAIIDLGIGQAFIQKQEEPTASELRSIFTASILLRLLTVFLIYLFSPSLVGFFQGQLGAKGIFWIRLFSVTTIFGSFKVISGFLLERRLAYFRLVFGEIGEIFINQGAAICLAFMGKGVESLIFAKIISMVFGVGIYFTLAPWPMSFSLSFQRLKNYLSFGLHFQAGKIVGTLDQALVPVVVGKLAGSAKIGLLNWAGGVAVLPQATAEIVSRLTFPLCSRAQKDKKLLGSIVERSIQFLSLTSFPVLAILFTLAYPITYLIYTDRWLPGLPALYILLLESLVLILGGSLGQVLLALGRVKLIRNVTTVRSVLHWLLGVPLLLLFGFTGIAMASFLVSLTTFFYWREVKKIVPIRIFPHLLPYLGFSLFTGLITFSLNQLFPIRSFWQLVFIAGIGGGIYVALLLIFKAKEIWEDVIKIKELIQLKPLVNNCFKEKLT